MAVLSVLTEFRDFEELMLARGVVLSYETIRRWCAKFGQAYANQLRRRRPRPGDKWHLDVAASTGRDVCDLFWAQSRLAVNLAAHSDRLARLLSGVVKHLPNHFYASIEAQVNNAAGEHRHLLDALRARDSQLARTITEHHIIESADYVVSMLEQRGLWAAEAAAG